MALNPQTPSSFSFRDLLRLRAHRYSAYSMHPNSPHLHLMDTQETKVRSSKVVHCYALDSPFSDSRYLCATNKDVVNGNVNQLDDVADEAHDEN